LKSTFLLDIEAYAINFITRKVPKEYTYHDVQHTISVVEAVQKIAQQMQLPPTDREILEIAAWFHDMGYDQGPEGHEERGCEYAAAYLNKLDFPPEKLTQIQSCIRATSISYTPQNLLEEIICDADLSHLGRRNYWDRCGRIRQEFATTRDMVMTDEEWVSFELGFMRAHQFNTTIAQDLYDKRKAKHIQKLERRQLKYKQTETPIMDLPVVKKKKKKKLSYSEAIKSQKDVQLKQINLGRGVETMYRTTYRTHINLSSIADNKANIMLSINAIIVSITLSTLVPKFDDNPQLIIPTVLLLVVCLIAIIFATLSTRPKITEGRFTRKDIEEKKSNLLFFGNFYNMSLEDYSWGMLEMIKDEDFLYSTMTRDLYYLGIVLAKKYRYLSYCYGIFMYGLILSVIVFAVVFIF